MLLFKKKFLPAIRSGEKTQTVRLWPFCRMRPGQRSYIPGVGYIRIDAVDKVQLVALTDLDARRDGFETADLLRAEIKELYADKLSSGYHAFRIRFNVLPPKAQEQAVLEKQNRLHPEP